MAKRTLAILTAAIFLMVSSACHHAPKKSPSPDPREEISSQKEIARSLRAPQDEEPWWKKDENQWLLAALIVVAGGIAIGAAIYIAFGPGGLIIRIQK